MCVLAGCDYCPNLPGIGLKNAWRLVRDRGGLEGALRQLRADGALAGSPSYPDDVMRAKQTFVFQRVWDPSTGRCVTLRPPEAAREWGVVCPNLNDAAATAFLGPPRDAATATAVAMGRIHPETLVPYPGEDLSAVPRRLGGLAPDEPEAGTDPRREPSESPAPTPPSRPFEILRPRAVGADLAARPAGLQPKITNLLSAPAARPLPRGRYQETVPSTPAVRAPSAAADHHSGHPSRTSPRRAAARAPASLFRPSAAPALPSLPGAATPSSAKPSRRLPALNGVRKPMTAPGWGGEDPAAPPPRSPQRRRPARPAVPSPRAHSFVDLGAFAYHDADRSDGAGPARAARHPDDRHAPGTPTGASSSPRLDRLVSPAAAARARTAAPWSGGSAGGGGGFAYSECGSAGRPSVGSLGLSPPLASLVAPLGASGGRPGPAPRRAEAASTARRASRRPSGASTGGALDLSAFEYAPLDLSVARAGRNEAGTHGAGDGEAPPARRLFCDEPCESGDQPATATPGSRRTERSASPHQPVLAASARAMAPFARPRIAAELRPTSDRANVERAAAVAAVPVDLDGPRHGRRRPKKRPRVAEASPGRASRPFQR